MPRKNNKLKKLAEEVDKRLHIEVAEATQPADAAHATTEPVVNTITPSGTEITKFSDPSVLSKWPKLSLKIPDIFLHKPTDFSQHEAKLVSMGIKFKKPYLGTYYTKISCHTLNDHKALTQYFQKRQLPFNTFGNASKRKLKVVIKKLPKDLDLNILKSELKLLNIPIVRVHQMKVQENTKYKYSLILAVVPYNEDGKKLLQLKKAMGFDVKLEPPVLKVKQCHRCQLWGHTQRYCHGQVKCVKCAGDHASKKCMRDPDTEPPKCANCHGEHTASYKKCPCCPASAAHIQTQIKKNLIKDKLIIDII